MTYGSTHDLVGDKGAGALKSADVVVRQVLNDIEADLANSESPGHRQLLVGIRDSELEAEALLALGKRSL